MVSVVGGRSVDMVSVKGLKLYRAEIKALDKAMKTWEPEVEDAAPRKRARGPFAMQCSCTPPRMIRAQIGTALGEMTRGTLVSAAPRIRCEACGQPFTIIPGQRVGEADRV